MFGRILCLLGLHRKALGRIAGGRLASDVYFCRCARPSCKWSRPYIEPRNETPPVGYPTRRVSR